MVTTAQDVAEMAKAAGMKRGQVLLKVEDFRAEAAKANEAGNHALGLAQYATAEMKFAEQEHWNELADLYRAAHRLM